MVIVKDAERPCQLTSGWLQSSVLTAVGWGARVIVFVGKGVKVGRNASIVGEGSGVFVDVGSSVGASVGGRGVALGMAASVCATAVDAMAMAVFCTSLALMAGVAGAEPHALTSTASKKI